MNQPPKYSASPAEPATGDIPGMPARRAALRLMDAVLRRGEALDQAAPSACQGLTRGDDRALALAIAAETLRWMADLDMLIDAQTRQPLGDDAKARGVLRLMLVQALRLEMPGHVVVATCLPLLTGGPRRLAHGVFSAVLKDAARLPEFPTLPESAALRWGEAWPDRIDAIARALAAPPPLDLVLRDPAETAAWAEKLDGVSLTPGHVRVARAGRIEGLPGFAEGAWWVQDLAATMPAKLLEAGEGRTVLDVCAAPGGKTMQLAAAGWRVTALDKSIKRLERLRANLQRTGLEADVVLADALTWEPDMRFDAILLDAPCSATGTCRRHPDVLHRLIRLDETGTLQKALLDRAAQWLAPGGRLVYAVCSLEPEEGEVQAATMASLQPDPIAAGELPAGLQPTAEGWLRTDPGMLAEAGGLDGFFVARWTAPF